MDISEAKIFGHLPVDHNQAAGPQPGMRCGPVATRAALRSCGYQGLQCGPVATKGCIVVLWLPRAALWSCGP